MLPEFDKNRLSDEELLERYETLYPPFSAEIAIPKIDIGFHNNIDFARLLMIRGENDDRRWAEKIISEVAEMQVFDDSRLFGHFPTRNNAGPGDLNSANFILPALLKFYEKCDQVLSPECSKKLRRCIDNLITALERRWDEEIFVVHRDFVGYTNIFLEYCSCLIMAGETLESERLKRKGVAQWRRWFNHVGYYGIDEFISPRYYEIGAHAMCRIYSADVDPLTREQARLALEHYFIVQHAVHHPLLEMPVGAGSRDYRKYLQPGDEGKVCFVGEDFYPEYPLPDEIGREYRGRVYPHRFSGRATAVPFAFQGYHEEDCGLATSTGGAYFPQQIFCMAAAGESPERRAVMIFPEKHSFVNGYTHQMDNEALCVFNRGVSAYSRTQMMLKDSLVRTKDDPRVPHMKCGILNSGWDLVENGEGVLRFKAYGREIRVYPFAVAGNRIRPVALKEGESCNFEGCFTVYEFPKELEWFGMFVSLCRGGEEAVFPRVTASTDGMRKRFSAEGDFEIQLIEYPGGECRQLFGTEMNETPLFSCPTRTIWPGELVATALENAGD